MRRGGCLPFVVGFFVGGALVASLFLGGGVLWNRTLSFIRQQGKVGAEGLMRLFESPTPVSAPTVVKEVALDLGLKSESQLVLDYLAKTYAEDGEFARMVDLAVQKGFAEAGQLQEKTYPEGLMTSVVLVNSHGHVCLLSRLTGNQSAVALLQPIKGGIAFYKPGDEAVITLDALAEICPDCLKSVETLQGGEGDFRQPLEDISYAAATRKLDPYE